MKFTKPQILLSLLIPPTTVRLGLYVYICSCMVCFPQDIGTTLIRKLLGAYSWRREGSKVFKRPRRYLSYGAVYYWYIHIRTLFMVEIFKSVKRQCKVKRQLLS